MTNTIEFFDSLIQQFTYNNADFTTTIKESLIVNVDPLIQVPFDLNQVTTQLGIKSINLNNNDIINITTTPTTTTISGPTTTTNLIIFCSNYQNLSKIVALQLNKIRSLTLIFIESLESYNSIQALFDEINKCCQLLSVSNLKILFNPGGYNGGGTTANGTTTASNTTASSTVAVAATAGGSSSSSSSSSANIIPLINLPNLTSLDLSNNQINQLQFGFGLRNLTHLNLSNNNIHKIENLSNLRKLISLNLLNNPIEKMENLSSMPQLLELKLSLSITNHDNKIENLEHLPNLTKLSLDLKNVHKLENLSQLYKLEELTLVTGTLTEIDDSFQYLIRDHSLDHLLINQFNPTNDSIINFFEKSNLKALSFTERIRLWKDLKLKIVG